MLGILFAILEVLNMFHLGFMTIFVCQITHFYLIKLTQVFQKAVVKVRKNCDYWPEYSYKSHQMVSLVSALTKTDGRMTFLVQHIWPFLGGGHFLPKWPKLAFSEQEMSKVHWFVGKRVGFWAWISSTNGIMVRKGFWTKIKCLHPVRRPNSC